MENERISIEVDSLVTINKISFCAIPIYKKRELVFFYLSTMLQENTICEHDVKCFLEDPVSYTLPF